MAGMEAEKVDFALAVAPLLFSEAAGAIYIGAGNAYLQNAPQINQVIGGAVGQYFPGGPPSPIQSTSDMWGRVGGWALDQYAVPAPGNE